MSHLPIEITRMIYFFLGYFPCQGRLISFAKIQKHIESSVDWFDNDKKDDLEHGFHRNMKLQLYITKDKKKYYILDRCRDNIIVILSQPGGWDVWEFQNNDRFSFFFSWLQYYVFKPLN